MIAFFGVARAISRTGDTAKPRNTAWIRHSKHASQQRSMSNLLIKEITVKADTNGQV